MPERPASPSTSDAPRGEVTRASTPPSGASVPPLPRRRGVAIAVGAVAIGGGALAVALLRNPPPATPPAPAVVAAPTPIAAPPPPAPPPRSREVTIDSDPSGADVFRGAERLGTTPLRYILDEGTNELDVTISKRGWSPHVLHVSTTGTRSYAVTLRAADRPRPTTPTVTTPTKPPAPPQKSGPRELKDVFAD
jgi:hypothetical protein